MQGLDPWWPTVGGYKDKRRSTSGYIAYCEGGRFEGQRGRGAAYDNDGKKLREFKGIGGNRVHHQNFIDAVRSRNHTSLNTDVEMGHLSTGWILRYHRDLGRSSISGILPYQ